MPELPEAEANRRRVDAGALNRTIEAVRLGNDTSYIDLPSKAERDRFVGTRLTRTHRHGKIIFAGSADGPWIAVHLGMTGSLRTYDAGDEAPDYVKLTFEFQGDRRLAYRCPRKLGWVQVCDGPDAWVEAKDWGPDALEMGKAAFLEAMGRSKGAIKSALMDQRKIAGIGNLWSDETLYQTGVAPDAAGTGLGEKKIGEIHRAMQRILRRVMEDDADYSKLPREWLIHTRKDGAECPRCGGTLKKMKVGGRSAVYCPSHQEAS